MKEINRHLGTVSLGKYFNKVLWVNISERYSGSPDIRISCTVPNLPDKWNDGNDLPQFKFGNPLIERRFDSYYVNGGIRWKSYYKLFINLDSIEELKAVVEEMKLNPNKGFFRFKIKKDIEHIINEYKISLL
jgi:hypothetical protein